MQFRGEIFFIVLLRNCVHRGVYKIFIMLYVIGNFKHLGLCSQSKEHNEQAGGQSEIDKEGVD